MNHHPSNTINIKLWYERRRWWWWRRYVVTTKLSSKHCRHTSKVIKIIGYSSTSTAPEAGGKAKPYTQQSNRDQEWFIPPAEEDDGVLLLSSMPPQFCRRVDKKIKYDVEEEERGSTTTTSLSGQQYTGEDIQIEEVIIVLIVWKEGRMDWNRLLVSISISIQQIQINGGRHRTNNRCVHKITTDWYYIILL